jgi:hypothetical protein
MSEFKEQLDAEEKEKVEKLMAELRELAVKGQAGDAAVTADAIREKIHETQQASLGLFKKVCPACSPRAGRRLTMFARFTRSARRRTRRRRTRARRRRRTKRAPAPPSFSVSVPPRFLVSRPVHALVAPRRSPGPPVLPPGPPSARSSALAHRWGKVLRPPPTSFRANPRSAARPCFLSFFRLFTPHDTVRAGMYSELRVMHCSLAMSLEGVA